MLVIINGHDTVFDDDTLAWESDDALNDVLIGYVVWSGASHGVFDTLRAVFFDLFLVFVHEDDDLATLGDVFLA